MIEWEYKSKISDNREKAMSKKSATFIIIAIVAVALISGVALVLRQKQEKPPKTEKSTTSTQKKSKTSTPTARSPSSVERRSDSLGILRKKPVLSYLLSKPAVLMKLQEDLSLTKEEIEEITAVVKNETENIHSLYQESQAIVKNRSLSPEERRRRIEDIRYNERVGEIIKESTRKVKEILGNQRYTQFVKWIEKEWEKERKKHMK